MGFVKGIFNAVADPRLFFVACGRRARRPARLEARADCVQRRSATVLLGLLVAVLRLRDRSIPNFRLIVTKPDNVPIVGLIFLLVFFTWYSIAKACSTTGGSPPGSGPIREGGVAIASGSGPISSTPS